MLIGVGTALADAPRLTTRHVPGPDPVRVVDPKGRLPTDSGLLHDGQAPATVLRAADGGEAERPLSAQATATSAGRGAAAQPTPPSSPPWRHAGSAACWSRAAAWGCFLEAGCSTGFQLAVSPMILGAGRPARCRWRPPLAWSAPPCARIAGATS
ncbi:MAG: hypothetical protein U1E17_04690 [Geminicoccaceae bacterium]